MRYYIALLVLMSVACGSIPPNPASPIVHTPVTATATRLTLVAIPPTLPVGGGSIVIYVELLSNNGIGLADATVGLKASSGTLANAEVTTDRTGHATVQWSSTQGGQVTATHGELTAVIAITMPSASR